MPGGDVLGPGGGCDGFADNVPSRNHIGHVHDNISHRLQVRDVDLSRSLNPGARYIAEGQYIVPHEFTAGNGNQNNNVSYREYDVIGPTPLGEFSFPPLAPTVSGAPAIDGEELRSFAREHLTGTQVPSRIVVVEALPRTPSLKVSQPGVKALFEE